MPSYDYESGIFNENVQFITTLGDTNITDPANGEALVYQDGLWINEATSGGSQLIAISSTERDALPTPATGTVISNSTTGTLQLWNGSAWVDITSSILQFSLDYLVIAGGGSGAGNGGVAPGSGGGAGGYRTTWAGLSGTEKSGRDTTTETQLTIVLGTNYSIQVGAGGAFGLGTYNGNPGTDSIFATITSVGGGGGATNVGTTSRNGGAGGGGGVGQSGGTGTTAQGFDGGTGATDGSSYYAGGGGGAGAVGQNGYPSNGGDGGVGLESSITGVATFRGGGGGGAVQGPAPVFAGTGGNGGGGSANNTAGTDGTGGGGGGNNGIGPPFAGRGGDGVVILRYPNTYTISAVGFVGLTMGTETAAGSDKYVQITCTSGGTTGTGSVSWS